MELFGIRFDVGIKVASDVAKAEFDGFADTRLGLFAETFIKEQPVLVAGVEEFADGFDLHFLPDGGDLLWAQAFYLEHFDDAGRGIFDVLLEEVKFAGFDDLADFFADGVPDALNGGDFVSRDIPDGGRELFEGEGGDGVR